jgi:hypothetical protein
MCIVVQEHISYIDDINQPNYELSGWRGGKLLKTAFDSSQTHVHANGEKVLISDTCGNVIFRRDTPEMDWPFRFWGEHG